MFASGAADSFVQFPNSKFFEADVVLKVAVTGAGGFVGRHVLSELLRRRVSVVASCRSPDRLTELPTNAEKVALDIRDDVDAFAMLGRPDVLIHLAWGGLPNYTCKSHFEVELPVQYRFLKKMAESGVRSMLIAGTCAEYGMQSGPISEFGVTSPVNSYGLAKDTLRRQLTFLKESTPFLLTWARLFYMYGPGQPATSLLPSLTAAAMRGDAMFPMSGGEQLRDYLHVTTVARYLVELALRFRDLGAVNVCAGRPVSVRSLAEKWVRENGWNIELDLGRFPYPDYESLAFWGDSQYLASILVQE